MLHALRRKGWILAAVFIVPGGILWWQRLALLTWYCTGALTTADDATRHIWAQRTASLDEAAVPALLAGLRSADESTCANFEAALVEMSRGWSIDDARTQRLAEKLNEQFRAQSAAGQGSAVRVLTAVIDRKGDRLPAPVAAGAAGVFLQAAPRGPTPHLLDLAAALLERASAEEWLAQGRLLANSGLKSSDAATRLAAVHLILREPLRQDEELTGRLPALLRDESPMVRREVLVMLARDRDRAGEDEILPLLHDTDAEVRRLCEVALRSRGLSERHITMARLISDEAPTARLQVLQHLGEDRDLDPGVWLRRLTQDASPAVRAAAVRAVGMHGQVGLTDRLREMAEQDPSETVRQNAQFYLGVTGDKR